MKSRISALAAAGAALLALCAPAAAQALQFSAEPSEGLEHARAALLAKSGATEIDVEIAYIDLNQDGRDDMFAFGLSGYFCGSAGCDPRIFVATDDGWEPVPVRGAVMINSAPGMWYLTNTQSGGWLSLALEEDGVDRAGLVWRGDAYEAIEPGP